MTRSLLLCVMLFLWTGLAYSQYVVSNFDEHPDSVFTGNYAQVSDNSEVIVSLETSIVQEGIGSMRYDYVVEAAETWGGFAKYEFWNPDPDAVWDFSGYENISFWYYNDASTSGTAEFRLQFFDVSDVSNNTYDAGQTELWYSFHYILDGAPGWNKVTMPMQNVGDQATAGGNGFWRTGWAGIAGNDQLDLEYIKGIGMEISIPGPQDFRIIDGIILIDDMRLEGLAPVDLVFFNGRIIPADKTPFAWNGAIAVEDNAGATAGTPALRWDQDAGQPWTGFGFDFDATALNLRWDLDTLKFKLKAPSGASTLRVQFADTSGNAIKAFVDEPTAGYNDQWLDQAIALKDITEFETGTTFDTSAVTKFEIMAEGTGNGYTIYFDDLWTGSPEIDIIPPDAPTSLFVSPETTSNAITWADVDTEDGETYNVYYSEAPITDVSADGVYAVEQGTGIGENLGLVDHLLFYPFMDTDVSYYYAVVAVDAAGNLSDPLASDSPISNTARGIGTMSLTIPTAFAADSDIGDWSGIAPIVIKPSEGANIATGFVVSDDSDLSVDAYMAGDATHFYFAFDVTDNVVDNSAVNTYEQDAPDLFIGFYDGSKGQHQAYQRGAEPDYQFRFLNNRVIIANIGDLEVLTDASADYSWSTSTNGYIIEGRIAWADLASLTGDTQFVPENGMRIPFDMSINDADGGGVRTGLMTWSPYNDDTSWQSPSFWLFTWVGEAVTGIDDEPNAFFSFDLAQNYPNPFNPSTTIRYQLARQSAVTLVVYNTLGQKVATLVNDFQPAGNHVINFDARDLSSGIYFYRIEAGDFISVKKMILMK